MGLQDLTPQLRTRLGRLERLVGLFIALATLLMLGGFTFYLYQTAQRKGWFLTKASYYTDLRSGAGLRVGDTVRLMGFDVGEITRITAHRADSTNDVYVEFVIKDPYIGYVWSDTGVKVKSAGLLGSRFLEVTKGGTSGTSGKLYATYKDKKGRLTEVYSGRNGVFTNYEKGCVYYLPAEEAPDLSAQMDQVIQAAKNALPNFLALTNPLQRMLAGAGETTVHMDEILADARPLLSNLTEISTHLREPKGSFGEWLIPPNLNLQFTQTLNSANTALLNANAAVTRADQHLDLLASNLAVSLDNLAGITSNLNAQVQANTNLITTLDRAIRDADDLVQGLKRHWLLRSAFKERQTNQPPSGRAPARPPRWEERR